MTDYDDYDDNEAWDEPYDLEYDDSDSYDVDDFDCGMVDDKRLCADIGTEHCSFFCPFHKIAMERNPDELPLPEGYEDEPNDDLPF